MEVNNKQILEWKEDLIKHKERLQQAQEVVNSETKLILMIEGGIQFGELLQKKHESIAQASSKGVLKKQSRKAPSE